MSLLSLSPSREATRAANLAATELVATELDEELRNIQLGLPDLEVLNQARLHNSTNSRFLSLPAEIRKEIFSQLFKGSNLGLRRAKLKRTRGNEKFSTFRGAISMVSRNIFLASKQCYHEARLRCYALATFNTWALLHSKNPRYCFAPFLANHGLLVQRFTVERWAIEKFLTIIDLLPRLEMVQLNGCHFRIQHATDRANGICLAQEAIKQLQNDHEFMCGNRNSGPGRSPRLRALLRRWWNSKKAFVITSSSTAQTDLDYSYKWVGCPDRLTLREQANLRYRTPR